MPLPKSKLKNSSIKNRIDVLFLKGVKLKNLVRETYVVKTPVNVDGVRG